ncbi:MAG TPA: hypothetical protein VF510_09150 [Ktedonobacterales bacterium]
MSNRKRSERARQPRSTNRLARWLRQRPYAGSYFRAAVIGLFLIGSAVAFAMVLIAQPVPSSIGPIHLPTLGQANTTTQPGNTTPNPAWVGVKSTQSGDITAAARATRTFQSVQASQTPLGNLLRTGTLGTPVLVHAYRPTPGMLDIWVIPVLQSADAHVVALLDFAYDKGQQRLHATTFAGPFSQGDPAYGQPFPRMTMQDALTQAQNKRHISMMSGTQPQLVYFPVDLDKTTGPHATIQWTGGGQFADSAIWLLRGADAKDYLVGNNGEVYTPDQLPLSPQAGS